MGFACHYFCRKPPRGEQHLISQDWGTNQIVRKALFTCVVYTNNKEYVWLLNLETLESMQWEDMKGTWEPYPKWWSWSWQWWWFPPFCRHHRSGNHPHIGPVTSGRPGHPLHHAGRDDCSSGLVTVCYWWYPVPPTTEPRPVHSDSVWCWCIESTGNTQSGSICHFTGERAERNSCCKVVYLQVHLTSKQGIKGLDTNYLLQRTLGLLQGVPHAIYIKWIELLRWINMLITIMFKTFLGCILSYDFVLLNSQWPPNSHSKLLPLLSQCNGCSWVNRKPRWDTNGPIRSQMQPTYCSSSSCN